MVIDVLCVLENYIIIEGRFGSGVVWDPPMDRMGSYRLICRVLGWSMDGFGHFPIEAAR